MICKNILVYNAVNKCMDFFLPSRPVPVKKKTNFQLLYLTLQHSIKLFRRLKKRYFAITTRSKKVRFSKKTNFFEFYIYCVFSVIGKLDLL